MYRLFLIRCVSVPVLLACLLQIGSAGDAIQPLSPHFHRASWSEQALAEALANVQRPLIEEAKLSGQAPMRSVLTALRKTPDEIKMLWLESLSAGDKITYEKESLVLMSKPAKAEQNAVHGIRFRVHREGSSRALNLFVVNLSLIETPENLRLVGREGLAALVQSLDLSITPWMVRKAVEEGFITPDVVDEGKQRQHHQFLSSQSEQIVRRLKHPLIGRPVFHHLYGIGVVGAVDKTAAAHLQVRFTDHVNIISVPEMQLKELLSARQTAKELGLKWEQARHFLKRQGIQPSHGAFYSRGDLAKLKQRLERKLKDPAWPKGTPALYAGKIGIVAGTQEAHTVTLRLVKSGKTLLKVPTRLLEALPTTRGLAKRLGYSRSVIERIIAQHHINPRYFRVGAERAASHYLTADVLSAIKADGVQPYPKRQVQQRAA